MLSTDLRLRRRADADRGPGPRPAGAHRPRAMRLSPAQSLRFCGRQFSPAELDRLRHWLAEGQCHRSELARRAGGEFGWVNGAGQLKPMSCRVALLRMERAGLLLLAGRPHNAKSNSI